MFETKRTSQLDSSNVRMQKVTFMTCLQGGVRVAKDGYGGD